MMNNKIDEQEEATQMQDEIIDNLDIENPDEPAFEAVLSAADDDEPERDESDIVLVGDQPTSEVDEALLAGSELESFESDEIEELEFIEDSQLDSIVESLLFATDKPVSLARFKEIFVGTKVTTQKIKATIERLAMELANPHRGVTLEEVSGGWQLRTKIDNQKYLQRSQKNRPFRLSGPALEVLSIVAYKQPIIKSEIDQIRGVESGHLLRALMERGLVNFGGKSDLPGRPMFYETTRKFLEIFGLRNLKELPTLSQIDELLPEGIDEIEADRKQGLGQITDHMGQDAGVAYSEGEEELTAITEDLQQITTSSEFFEQEKLRQKKQQEAEKAQNLKEALLVGETLSTRDANWLKRYEEALEAEALAAAEATTDDTVRDEEPAEVSELSANFSDELEALTDENQIESLSQEDEDQDWEAMAIAVDTESAKETMDTFDEPKQEPDPEANV